VKLRYTLPALADLSAILDYIAAHSPQGARRVQARIRAVTDLLLLHPHIGRRTSDPAIRRFADCPITGRSFAEYDGMAADPAARRIAARGAGVGRADQHRKGDAAGAVRKSRADQKGAVELAAPEFRTMNEDLKGNSLADVLEKLEKGKIGHRAAMEWLNITSYERHWPLYILYMKLPSMGSFGKVALVFLRSTLRVLILALPFSH
jgi:toxin ParE1/3/4